MELSAGKLWGMRRMADENGLFKMLAVDQRPPIKNLVKEKRAVDEAGFKDVAGVKRALVRALAPHATASLLDPHFAYPYAIGDYSPRSGLIVTMEDSVFEETPGGRNSSEIDNWSVEKVKRAGGDAVKVLTWYRPDAGPAVIQNQKDFTKRVGDACAKYDLPYVFELLVYPLPGDAGHTTDYVEQPGKRIDHVIESVVEFAKPDYGVDLFKLESPLPAAEVPAPDGDPDAVEACRQAYKALGEAAGRPWVMLSAGAKPEAFARVLHYAYGAGASGFLAGRAIWWQAFSTLFPDLEALEKELAVSGVRYMKELNALTDQDAMPWHEHAVYGKDGPVLAGTSGNDFRKNYYGFD